MRIGGMKVVRKRMLILVVCLVFVLSLVPSVSFAAVEEFTFDSSTGTITRYKGIGGDVVIPSTIGGVAVTSIHMYAFAYCRSLTSITIPNSVTSISDYAFYDCTELTSANIPNGVTRINDSAFYGCASLTSVDIPNSVTSIGESAFSGCTSLTSVTIPNSVASIKRNAFSHSGLTSITIPNRVTSIEYSAFSFCTSLTSIMILNSVTSIGSFAFSECRSLTSIVIPNSVTSIGSYAFDGCSSLTSITIPNSVTSIGSYAFDGCSSLTSITIPNSVTRIEDAVFRDCNSLTSIFILNSEISIGSYAIVRKSDLTIYGFEPSNAKNYAYQHNIPFESIGDSTLMSDVTFNVNNAEIPVIGANVTLEGGYSGTTDTNGKITFTSIINGVYNFTISKIGVLTSSGSITVNNANVTQNVVLVTPTVTPTLTPTLTPTPNPTFTPRSNNTYLVSKSGGDFNTISSALATVPAGSIINVAPGEYIESIVIDKKLILNGSGMKTSKIRGGVPNAPCVSIQADGVKIRGFEITGGYPGIEVNGNNSKIEFNKISENLSTYKYKLMYFDSDGSPIYEGRQGLGVRVISDNCMLKGNLIVKNSGGRNVGSGSTGIEANNAISLKILNNTISENTGYRNDYGCGIVANNSTGSIINNIITNNDAYIDSSVSLLPDYSSFFPEPYGNGILLGNNSVFEVDYNDVWDNNSDYNDKTIKDYVGTNPGTHDISQDPKISGEYYDLGATSPCIKAANLNGVMVDIGASGAVVSSPDVILSHDQSDNTVRDADTVLITATFDGDMLEAPTVNIDITENDVDVNNLPMTKGNSANKWTYTWNVPQGHDGLAKVTVAGKATSGVAYAGTDNLMITIDNTAPTATVVYNITTPTYKNVIAAIIPSENNVTVTNNNKLSTYTFTSNGSFTFNFVDMGGNTGNITATVNNIDGNLPKETPEVLFQISL